MKILQIFGAVVAVHLLAFLFIFASPGCQSGPRITPTPDATVPHSADSNRVGYSPAAVNPQPVTYTPVSTSGHTVPTRPGSAAAVAVTPAKPVENIEPVSTYTVERGDSFWSIAKKNNLSVNELAKANNLASSTVLQPGRKLIIPGKPAAAPQDLATAPLLVPLDKSTGPANGETVKHTVQVGESLGVIARKYQVTVGELAAANNITDPSKVRAGQQLVIPGFKAISSKGPAPAVRPAAANATPPAAAPKPVAIPHFEIAPPPPGQDLDSGLKNAETEVPTIRVETPAPANPTGN